MSQYIAAALERMRLPIRVRAYDDEILVVEVRNGPFSIVVDASDATEAYFDFVAFLSKPGTPSSPSRATAADCSASPAPERGV